MKFPTKTPKISIITPSYNQGSFIERTISSVCEQSYPYWEHIIIDGGSTDNTVEILQKYPHLKWISEPDRGQVHAINKGISISTGDIIAYINSDDYILPGAFDAVVNFFNSNSAIDYLYGDSLLVDKNGQILHTCKSIRYNWGIMAHGRSLINQPASYFTRLVLEAVGGFNESYDFCMDQEHWVHAAIKKIKFGNIPFLLAAARMQPNSKSSTIREKLNFEHKHILKHYCQSKFSNLNILNDIYFHIMLIFYRSYGVYRRCVERREFKLGCCKKALILGAKDKDGKF